jgi:hypothetical protein
MATHDYVIDNSTGANVRADINLVLQAILTNNSSSSAPSTTAAYMWWADTTNGVLKIRNSSNNDWVELLQLDGTLTLEDGSASTPALAFRDDLNTGIFSSAADTFNVATAGVERMELGATTIFNEDGADVDFRIEGDTRQFLFYVDASTDRIGIDRSSPDAVFHIFDNPDHGNDRAALKVEAFRPKIRLQDRSSSSNSAEILCDSNALRFNVSVPSNDTTNLTERMRIDSSGRVLIGTSTGAAFTNRQLSVSSNSGTTAIELRSATDGDGRIIFTDSTTSSDTGSYKCQIKYLQDSDDFTISSNGDNERFRIDSFGNVGIGTSTINDDPEHCKLVISGQSGNAAGILIFQDTSNNEDGAIFADNGNLYFVADRSNATSGSNMIFRVDGSTERMRLDSSGNLGIGTTSPTYHLEVQGSGVQTILAGSTNAAGAALILDGDSNGDGSGSDYASITHTSDGHIEINNRKSAAIIFKTTSSETERARITSSGVLLLNVSNSFDSTSNAILQIDGDAAAGIAIDGNSTSSQSRISFFNPNGRVGVITTDGSATVYGTSSDYRLKENATAISDGITRIKTLKPYRFNFKSDATKTLDGFFAHEVTAVPEAIVGTKDEVDSDNNPIYQGIDQSKLVPLLVACCQELITKVEALESA